MGQGGRAGQTALVPSLSLNCSGYHGVTGEGPLLGELAAPLPGRGSEDSPQEALLLPTDQPRLPLLQKIV